MIFFVKNANQLIVPENGYFYTDGTSYSKFETNKGYVLVEQADVDTEKLVEVDNKTYSYYGFFGYLKDAEITDVVMGRNAYVYKGEGSNTYSGILAAYASNTKFYNVYDSGAEINAFVGEESGKYVATADAALVEGKEYFEVVDGVMTKVASPVVDNIANYFEKVYKIDAGKNTYYYKQSSSPIALYDSIEYTGDVAVLPEAAAFSITLSAGNVGEIIIEDRSYNVEYDAEECRLMFVIKDRYLLSETVDSVSTIIIDGTTYYINTTSQPAGAQFSLHTDAEMTTEGIWDEDSNGFITIDEREKSYVFIAGDK